MLISHSKKFIFIHNYKVAGTSIKHILKDFSNINFKQSPTIDKIKILLGIYPRIFSNNFHVHIKSQELKEKIPEEIFRDYFKFGFVRNPWDWQVSLYTYMLKNKNHFQHKLIKKMNFEEYIQWRVDKDLRFQKDFFFDVKGNKLVDFIGKFENLNNDFKIICVKIGVDATLPHLNKSRTDPDYLSYYSQETIDLVYDAFKDDIKTFKYNKPNLKS